MNYKVRIPQKVINQVIEIGKFSSFRISNFIFDTLKHLDFLPWMNTSDSSRYNIDLPNNMRCVPIKNYVGLYYIKGDKVVIFDVVSQSRDIKSILLHMKHKILNGTFKVK